jgi:2'-hydroxyisoflavone reductase
MYLQSVAAVDQRVPNDDGTTALHVKDQVVRFERFERADAERQRVAATEHGSTHWIGIGRIGRRDVDREAELRRVAAVPRTREHDRARAIAKLRRNVEGVEKQNALVRVDGIGRDHPIPLLVRVPLRVCCTPVPDAGRDFAHARTVASRSMAQVRRILVLGGTRFLGRAFVDAALARGHAVTLFNRGETNPDLFPDVEKLRGDRERDLSVLDGGSWDAVVDVAAYFPRVVELSVARLRAAVGRYVFVSSISVYADQSVPPHEDAEVAALTDPEDASDDSYGARKAACERIVRDEFGTRATIVRPGLIVGPHDPTDRFSYWPKRIARGGRVLAPGDPNDPLQFVDVRDLAAFVLRLVEDDRGGTFNATGKVISFGELLRACREVTRADAELVWVPSTRLLEAGLDPWMGVPLWIGAPGWEAANRVSIDRALDAGLTFRPLEETIAAALADETPPRLVTALPAEREAELLRRLA